MEVTVKEAKEKGLSFYSISQYSFVDYIIFYGNTLQPQKNKGEPVLHDLDSMDPDNVDSSLLCFEIMDLEEYLVSKKYSVAWAMGFASEHYSWEEGIADFFIPPDVSRQITEKLNKEFWDAVRSRNVKCYHRLYYELTNRRL